MEGFVALVPFIIVVSIIVRVVKAASKATQSGTSENVPRNMPRQPEEVRAWLEQSRRERLEAAKAQSQFRQGARTVSKPPEKPVYEHSTDDCTGGSIHDGYHEGTIRRPTAASSAEGNQGAQGARRGIYAAGTTGLGMQGAEGMSSSAHITGGPLAAGTKLPTKSGAEKLADAIKTQPGIVQGIIWSEVLGKPLSD